MKNKSFKFEHNYHTHTTFCRHATETPEEMVLVAIKNGYKTIGFSEHAPLKVHRNFRLNLHSWTDYIDEISRLKKVYKNKITILCGLEAEYHHDEYTYYKKLRNTPGIDYMILGNHNMGSPHDAKEWNKNRYDVDIYAEQMIDAVKSGLFSAIAHPDIIYRYYHSWDQDAENLANLIIDTSIKYDIPIGFNINGLMCKKTPMEYPNDYFWKLVSQTDCKVMLEADAHAAKTMEKASVNKAIKLIKKWNLEKNLISKMKLV